MILEGKKTLVAPLHNLEEHFWIATHFKQDRDRTNSCNYYALQRKLVRFSILTTESTFRYHSKS